MPSERERAAAIADAVAAFDAANLAWGQFYQNTWRRRGEAARAQAQPLRDALGNAALYVPELTSIDGLRGFVASLEDARAQLLRLIGEVSDVDSRLLPGDVRDLDGLLEESAGYLRPYLDG
jgi:hypothetical protein